MTEIYEKTMEVRAAARVRLGALSARAQRQYRPLHLLLLFFAFSAVGYVWEVLVDVVRCGVLVNRGVLYGPWLPIYGVVGVALVLLCKRFADKPGQTFLLTAMMCGVIEYAASWILEAATGLRWWDYSFMPLDIHGRVSVEVLFFFAAAGMAGLYLLAPALDDKLQALRTRTKGMLAAVLCTGFVCDLLVALLLVPNTSAV